MGKRRRERRGKRDLAQEARKKQCMGSNMEEDAVRGMEEARKTLVREEMGGMKMGMEKKGAIACVGARGRGKRKKPPEGGGFPLCRTTGSRRRLPGPVSLLKCFPGR